MPGRRTNLPTKTICPTESPISLLLKSLKSITSVHKFPPLTEATQHRTPDKPLPLPPPRTGIPKLTLTKTSKALLTSHSLTARTHLPEIVTSPVSSNRESGSLCHPRVPVPLLLVTLVTLEFRVQHTEAHLSQPSRLTRRLTIIANQARATVCPKVPIPRQAAAEFLHSVSPSPSCPRESHTHTVLSAHRLHLSR
jgi:hypothetical protein